MRLFLLLIIFVLISQGLGQANHKLSNQKKEMAQEIQIHKIGFTYLRTITYSCGGVTNTVREYFHNQTGMEFILIPAGSFMMGSNNGDDNAKPVHQVTISKPFLMSKYEVIQTVWQEVMGDNPSRRPKGDNYPVVWVSWNDAIEFCEQTGLELPTEAQWEYACRAGTQTKFYWGNTIDGAYTWYNKNSGDQPHEVGLKKTNAFGLSDMSGNVWEWCRDSARKYSSMAAIDPVGAPQKIFRAFRGGSCSNLSINAFCSAERAYDLRERRYPIVGFRTMRSLSDVNVQKSLVEYAKDGNIEKVKYFISTKANVNTRDKNEWTILMIAASRGHKELVKMLIAAKADINAKDKNGRTSIMLASSWGHKETVDILISAKANISARNQLGQTSLIMAAERGYKEIVESLIAAGANINANDKNGRTSLLIAVEFSETKAHRDIVKILIAAKADINAHYQNGHTALTKALLRRDKKMAKLLITAKIDITTLAVMIAKRKGYKEILATEGFASKKKESNVIRIVVIIIAFFIIFMIVNMSRKRSQ